jgi:hypothetical protein
VDCRPAAWTAGDAVGDAWYVFGVEDVINRIEVKP